MDAVFPQMRRVHHGGQCRLDRSARIGEEVRHPGERLVRLGIKHMQNGPDEQRVAGLFPVIAPFKRAFRIDQHVGDVLHVAHLVDAASHFHQRVIGRRCLIGRIEQKRAAEPGTETSCQLPVLAFDIVHDRRMRPGQERWHDKADPFAAAGRREAEHMFGAVVTKIEIGMLADNDALACQKARA